MRFEFSQSVDSQREKSPHHDFSVLSHHDVSVACNESSATDLGELLRFQSCSIAFASVPDTSVYPLESKSR
jgi:hypothetical protein